VTVVASEPTSYDHVPYTSLAFSQTHPDRLATIARMFSLMPADVSRCRVLELGSASGGNLIPMAVNLPDSELVGMDLSRRQVEDARGVIAALGLRNIRMEHASILDIDDRWGQFDYILCHGVYSWVDSPVQDKILQICAANLTPQGVAYVSYNTYPGWHMREMVRHMMRYHAGRFEEPTEQVEQARALLAFLASASNGRGPYGELLNQEVERLGRASDSYLFHEHLEQTNAPCYFHQFTERAERAGLMYLSEASVSDMLTSHFPPAVAETLERISPDILHLEQYMDFVRNRQFRQTLLCRKDVKPKRALTPAFMHGLLVSSRAIPEKAPVDLSSTAPVVFWNGKQRADVLLPASKAAFTVLMERWPEAIEVDALCEEAIERVAPYLGETPIDEARRAVMGDLFGAVMYGMVHLHSVPPRCTNAPSDSPKAHPLAAYQASVGKVVVNAHHDTFDLDAFALEVLKLADGQRTREGMLDVLLALHADGRLVLEQEGTTITEPGAARTILADRLNQAIALLTRSALLVA
jgi:methyltransferase-like protein/2-polyprenyl-3-methyl-5-hydroxy-6-metoxy-1,4-benzoquinol methylase